MPDHIVKSIDYPHFMLRAGRFDIAVSDDEVRLKTAAGWRLITNRLILALVAELAGWEAAP